MLGNGWNSFAPWQFVVGRVENITLTATEHTMMLTYAGEFYP